MVMGCVQPGTSRGMFLQMIGSRKTVPPRMFLMVPLGLFHIFFNLNSKRKELRFKKAAPNHQRWRSADVKSSFDTFHSGLVWRDGSTFDRYAVFLCSQGGVDGDLVVGLVAVWQAQVKIFQLNINVSQDELQTTKHKFQSGDNASGNIVLLSRKMFFFITALLKRPFTWQAGQKSMHLEHFYGITR